MPRTITFNGVTHSFPDDATDAEIAEALNGPTQTKTPMGGMLPTAGGLVGSLVGGAGGALLGPAGALAGRTMGAGVGGALGKGAEMLLDDQPQSISQGLSEMGQAGALQAAGEGIGIGAGKLLGAAAPRLMQSMMKPSMKLRGEFPTVALDAVKYGIPIGQGGLKKVGKLIGENTAKVNDKLQMME